MAERNAVDMPAWQAFCYRHEGWRFRVCFYVAGFLMLRPAPYNRAGRIYSAGGFTSFGLIVACIPAAIFGLGFLIGRL